jgi:hypothetical protein
MPKAIITVYSRPKGTPCPPKDDLGGWVQLDRWHYIGDKPQQTPAKFEVEVGSEQTLYVKGPAKSSKCTWNPGEGQREIATGAVPAQGLVCCTDWVCAEASVFVAPLSGDYIAKRIDQPTQFSLRMTFQVNSEHCLYGELDAPGAIDHGEAHLHTCQEPGNHGYKPHRGDFMQANAPLTEGFLQGTFRGPRGEEGSFRMALGALPAAQGLYTPVFGGFLTFASNPQANIETTFTRSQPVTWPGVPAGVPA